MTRPPLAQDDRLSWHPFLKYWRFELRDVAKTVIETDTLEEMRLVIDQLEQDGRLPPLKHFSAT